MFVKDIGFNAGKLLALSPKVISLRNERCFKIVVLVVCLGLYLTVLFAFASPETRFRGQKDIIGMLEVQTGIWLAEYTKEQLALMY